MRLTICVSAVLVLAAVAVPAAAKTAAFQLNKTTWTFTDKKGVKVRESIDENGNYIANSRAGKHLDHGTGVMKGDKACFTSAMTKEGEICWTTKPVAIGHSMVTKSDKGETLKVTRVAYKPLSMPK
jgi:predicted secreted Zn-dependent protease